MEDRHQKFVAAALTVFSRYGVTKTTMNDIAAEAGVTRQTLYNTYRNKESILRATVRLSVDDMLRQVLAAWQTTDDLGEKLDTYFQLGPLAWYDLIQASPEAADLVDGIHSIAGEEMRETRALWTDQFETLIRAHMPKGHPSDGLAANLADYIYSTSLYAKTDATDRATVEQRLDMLKRSVLALLA